MNKSIGSFAPLDPGFQTRASFRSSSIDGVPPQDVTLEAQVYIELWSISGLVWMCLVWIVARLLSSHSKASCRLHLSQTATEKIYMSSGIHKTEWHIPLSQLRPIPVTWFLRPFPENDSFESLSLINCNAAAQNRGIILCVTRGWGILYRKLRNSMLPLRGIRFPPRTPHALCGRRPPAGGRLLSSQHHPVNGHTVAPIAVLHL